MWLKSALDCCTEILFLYSGFWVVSTSEDDVSELQSDESNPEEVEWEDEKDNNDIEVMNILSQIERINGTEHIENDVMIKNSDSHESASAEKVSKYFNLYYTYLIRLISINGYSIL